MTNFIGMMAMVFGFIGIGIKHYDGGLICFSFAFILWFVKAAFEYKDKKGGAK